MSAFPGAGHETEIALRSVFGVSKLTAISAMTAFLGVPGANGVLGDLGVPGDLGANGAPSRFSLRQELGRSYFPSSLLPAR
jgi:hypothetical protein